MPIVRGQRKPAMLCVGCHLQSVLRRCAWVISSMQYAFALRRRTNTHISTPFVSKKSADYGQDVRTLSLLTHDEAISFSIHPTEPFHVIVSTFPSRLQYEHVAEGCSKNWAFLKTKMDDTLGHLCCYSRRPAEERAKD